MKRILLISLAIVMTAAFMGCTGTVSPSPAEQTTEVPTSMPVSSINEKGQIVPLSVFISDENKLSSAQFDPRYKDANNDFAITMINAMDEGWTGVFSPLSLQIALQILANGGDPDIAYDLLSEICPGMTMDVVNESSAKLISLFLESKGVSISNAVIVDKMSALCEEFANKAADYYRASVGALDFSDPEAALAEVNRWVEENTDGLIKELLDELEDDTSVVILNALTLKLDWEKQFTAMRELTEFNGANGKTQLVGMIQKTDKMQYGEFEQGQMAIVPYVGNEYAMAVILPAYGFSPAEAAASILGRTDECSEKAVFLSMPKIDVESKLDILAMADKLNIDSGVSGMYNKIVAGESVQVTQIVHGAMLSVTEYGTTAAAATAIVGRKGIMLPEAELICNRPYAMVIYHVETGAVLFVSLVNDAA